MDKNAIFGPSIKLPTIEGIQSGCEEELYMLMKEVDTAYEKKHKDVIQENENLRILCLTKDDEIKNLKLSLASKNKKDSQSQKEEELKSLKQELAKMKEENRRVKTENSAFQQKLQQEAENKNQLESLKKSLSIQQDENGHLRSRLENLSRQHNILQENYQRLFIVLKAEQTAEKNGEAQNYFETLSANLVDSLVAHEAEACMKEESEKGAELQSALNRKIDDIKKLLIGETT